MRTAFIASSILALAVAAPAHEMSGASSENYGTQTYGSARGTSTASASGSTGSAPAPTATATANGTAKADIDVKIINYALTLELLEAAFYVGGLNKYSAADFLAAGYPADVRQRMTQVAREEVNHAKFLSGALTAAGATPVTACNYSFPDTSPTSFLAVAQILEGVGISAYLGAASLITNPAYLTAAGSILAIEARHNTFIRSAQGKNVNPVPQTFDTPLDFNEVFTMASGFITSCPSSNAPLAGVKAFPTLAIGTTGTIVPGQQVQLSYNGSTSAQGAFVVFLNGLGQIAVPYNASTGLATIPASYVNEPGQIYAVVTSSNATVTDAIILAGPVTIEVFTPIGNVNYNI